MTVMILTWSIDANREKNEEHCCGGYCRSNTYRGIEQKILPSLETRRKELSNRPLIVSKRSSTSLATRFISTASSLAMLLRFKS